MNMIDVPILQKTGDQCVKKMPVILPHRLVEQLLEDGLFVDDAEARTRAADYWAHLAKQEQVGAWAKDPGLRTAHPVYLWGDDAQHNERQEKLVVVAMGLALDPTRNSMMAMWTLFTYKAEPRLQLVLSITLLLFL